MRFRPKIIFGTGLLLLGIMCANYLISIEITKTNGIMQENAENQLLLSYLQSQLQTCAEDMKDHKLLKSVAALLDLLNQSTASKNPSVLNHGEATATADELMMKSMLFKLQSELNSQSDIHFPSVYTFLPHTLDDPHSLSPAYSLSAGRAGVSLVLGIPTVKRPVENYLMITLKELVKSMDKEEEDDTLIVVFIGEIDTDYIHQVATDIETIFPNQVKSGLIEVVAPSPSYYPPQSSLHDYLGDPPERVAWRAKQTLDFAFLMAYCSSRGKLYVQLEDDVITTPGSVTTMKKFAIEKTQSKIPWFILDFCELGFIGKMFKTAELPRLIEYFIMFYSDQPVDWLLQHFLETKVCRRDRKPKDCQKAIRSINHKHKPSLFQHVGKHSSLKGKLQNLKDPGFEKIPLFIPHHNPSAEVNSGNLKIYENHSLERAYKGETFFWGIQSEAEERLSFKFTPAVTLQRFKFVSGNAEAPLDIFYNATVELQTHEGLFTAGKFDSIGRVEVNVSHDLGPIEELQLNIHSTSDHWIVLNTSYYKGIVFYGKSISIPNKKVLLQIFHEQNWDGK